MMGNGPEREEYWRHLVQKIHVEMFCCKEELRNKQKLAGEVGPKRGDWGFCFKTGEKQHRTMLLGMIG